MERYMLKTNEYHQKYELLQEQTGDNDAAPAANDTPAQGPTVTRKDLISKKEDVQINALR